MSRQNSLKLTSSLQIGACLKRRHCLPPASCWIFNNGLYFEVRVRCRRKRSSRSQSHLLMSFLFGLLLLHIDRRKCCQVSSTVTSSSHWAPIFVLQHVGNDVEGHAVHVRRLWLACCRQFDGSVSDLLRRRCHYTVLAGEVHGPIKTQVSVLLHQSRPSVLRLLHSVSHHVYPAARMWRTHRCRSVFN